MSKKYVLIGFFVITSIQCYSQGGKKDSLNRYDSSNQKMGRWIGYWTTTKNIASDENFFNGRRNGLCLYYYMTGIIREKSQYINDTLNGISNWYSPTGALREIAEFKLGKREGFTREYNYEKKLIEEQEYHNNLRNGINRTFYESGRIETVSNFIDGKESGTRTTYRDNDIKEIILETDFVDNVRVERRYFKNGRLIKVEKENPHVQEKSELK